MSPFRGLWAFLFGRAGNSGTIPVITGIPARTLYVGAEPRTLYVAAESRTVSVAAENRTLMVEGA